VAAFEALHPDIEVVWTARSLRDFGEASVVPLSDQYDIIVADHPFAGTAHETGCLVDLRGLVPDVVDRALGDEVGKSARSYHFGGGVWGLPTDAAAQVASYRPDLLIALGADVPRTHADVLALARAARANGTFVAVPACPTDAACLVMSYAANLGHPAAAAPGVFLDRAVLTEVLDLVAELVPLCHPSSPDWNPIRTYEAMSSGDEIVYVPLAFGYSNYSRPGRERLIRATNFAGPGPDPAAGALLGGAGCTITHSCRDPEAAATYLRWLHAPDVMKGILFESGGQPGSRAAWTDDAVNAASSDFFRGTLTTLDRSYLRPTFHGFVPFFEETGIAVNAFLRGRRDRDTVAADILDRYEAAFAAAAVHA
jgi:multiple sugar transport system substrate-binding protein